MKTNAKVGRRIAGTYAQMNMSKWIILTKFHDSIKITLDTTQPKC